MIVYNKYNVFFKRKMSYQIYEERKTIIKMSKVQAIKHCNKNIFIILLQSGI